MTWFLAFHDCSVGCLNGTHIGPMVRLTDMCVGLFSVGCSAWWRSSEIIIHVQVVGKASSVLLLESNAIIWAVLVTMILFSKHMQISFLWLSSHLASLSASAGSNSSFTRAFSI